MYRQGWFVSSLIVSIACTVGCDSGGSKYGYGYGSPKDVRFHDDALANTEVEDGPFELKFVDTTGNDVSLSDYRGRKNVVLVFTRGFYGRICPYCTTQTSRLIANYEEFTQRDAEVVVVFPGDGAKVDAFIEASIPDDTEEVVPFPIVLDESLAAVDTMSIREELAKPSTFILDKQGEIRFAYVGSTLVDRPSIKAVLAQLDAIND